MTKAERAEFDDLKQRVEALETKWPEARLNPHRCHWEMIQGIRVFLPGCYGSLHGVGLDGCYCKKYLKEGEEHKF